MTINHNNQNTNFGTKKYLISGLPPSSGGVGRLMKNLTIDAQNNNYEIIYRRQQLSIRLLAKSFNLVGLAREIISRIENNITFKKKLKSIINAEIIALHPQSISFPLFDYIIKKNKVKFYVMDNSFFCMRSYNNNPITNKECTKCLVGPNNAEKTCSPWPNKLNKKSYIKSVNEIRKKSHSISFFTQNKSQEKLIKEFYGENVHTRTVGLNTGELEDCLSESKDLSRNPSYDFAFHGATHIAKGIDFLVQLSKIMPNRVFFIPDDKSNVEKTLQTAINNVNIVFMKCNWEGGLKQAILNSKIILNLSTWSAPIEGALLKSVVIHPRVATIKTEFGFEKDLSESIPLLRLPHDADKAALILEEALQNPPSNQPSPALRYQSAMKYASASDIFDISND